MIILIDNYDSFTYNLFHLMAKILPNEEIRVLRNDELSVDEITELKPQAIVISPGPSAPKDAGICLELIKAFAPKNVPIFGVCLGMQAMAESFGANIVRATKPMHGKVDNIYHSADSIFTAMESPFIATRYHSLIVEQASLSDDFKVIATSADNVIQAICHKTLPLYAVQFHPESIATKDGAIILKNFFNLVGIA